MASTEVMKPRFSFSAEYKTDKNTIRLSHGDFAAHENHS